VFIAGRYEERGDALVAEINEAGGKAHFVELVLDRIDEWAQRSGVDAERTVIIIRSSVSSSTTRTLHKLAGMQSSRLRSSHSKERKVVSSISLRRCP